MDNEYLRMTHTPRFEEGYRRLIMNNVGDKYTFYYIERHCTDDNGNPVEFDNGDEWEDLNPAQECAKAFARVASKGETICLCKATHEIIEAYDV